MIVLVTSLIVGLGVIGAAGAAYGADKAQAPIVRGICLALMVACIFSAGMAAMYQP